MKIERIKGDFTVCKVSDGTKINLNSEYCFIGKTDEEISVICPTEDTPFSTTAREDGWSMFRLQGVFDFSEIGVLAKLSALLAEIHIGILAVSTFNTDYILVKRENESRALQQLATNGYQILQ